MSVEQRIDADQSQKASDSDSRARTPRPSLQSLLLEAGIASDEELRHAFEEGQLRGLRLGEVVLARGWLDEVGLARLLARQWGLPFLGRESLGLDLTATGLLSPEQARSLRGCVISVSNGGPLVVVAEPTTERMGALEAQLGTATRFAVVTESSLERLLEQRDRVGLVAAPMPAPPEAAGPAGGASAEEEHPTTEPGDVVDGDTAVAEDAETDVLVADLERATLGLTAARERIEQLADARRGAEQMLTDLHERLAGLDRERAREQERSTHVQAELDAERARFGTFRSRLAELLAEFED
jgi:MshEN domain